MDTGLVALFFIALAAATVLFLIRARAGQGSNKGDDKEALRRRLSTFVGGEVTTLQAEAYAKATTGQSQRASEDSGDAEGGRHILRAVLEAIRHRDPEVAEPRHQRSGHGSERMVGASGGMRLRPMGIWDILAETFRLYSRHFLSFLVAMAVVIVPAELASIALGLAGAEAASGIIGLAQYIGYLLSSGAVIRLAADAALGESLDVGAAYRAALARFWSLLWSSILVFLATGLMAVTIIGIPFAIYFGVGWAFVEPAVMLEQASGRGAMRRGSELVDGHRWRLLVMILLAMILVIALTALVVAAMVIAGVSMEPTTWASVLAQIGNPFVSAAAQSVFGSLGWIALTVLYFDLRVRNEGFDALKTSPYANAGARNATTGQFQRPFEDYDEAIRHRNRQVAQTDKTRTWKLKLVAAATVVAIGGLALARGLGAEPKPLDAIMGMGGLELPRWLGGKPKPLDAKAYLVRSVEHMGRGERYRAIEAADEAIRLDPQLALAYSQRANAYLDIAEFERAIEDYDQAIHLEESQRGVEDSDRAFGFDAESVLLMGTYSGRGLAYLKLGQYRRALKDLDEAVRLKPEHENPRTYRAIAYAALGLDAEARADFEKAAARGAWGRPASSIPDHPLNWVVLTPADSVELEQSMEKEKSRAAAHKEDALKLQNLGEKFLREGKLGADVAELFRQAAIIAPEDVGVRHNYARVLFSRGRLFYRDGDSEEGKAIWRQAEKELLAAIDLLKQVDDDVLLATGPTGYNYPVSKSGPIFGCYFALGEVYKHAFDDRQKARLFYQNALDYDAQKERAREAVKEIESSGKPSAFFAVWLLRPEGDRIRIDDPAMLEDLLEAAWGNEDWPTVVNVLERQMEVEPHATDRRDKLYAAHVFYGDKHLATGDKYRAAVEFNYAIALDPGRGEATLRRQGLPDANLPAVVDSMPIVDPAERLSRQAFMREGQTGEALVLLREATRLTPDHPSRRGNYGSVLFQKGSKLYQAGNKEEGRAILRHAEKELLAAIRLSEETEVNALAKSNWFFLLGDAYYYDFEDRAKAKGFYQDALKQYPAHDGAREAMKRF